LTFVLIKQNIIKKLHTFISKNSNVGILSSSSFYKESALQICVRRSDVGLDALESAHVAERAQLLGIDSPTHVVQVELTQVSSHLKNKGPSCIVQDYMYCTECSSRRLNNM